MHDDVTEETAGMCLVAASCMGAGELEEAFCKGAGLIHATDGEQGLTQPGEYERMAEHTVEFLQQPGLAHARLAKDADHLSLPLDHLGQASVQEGKFSLPPHKGALMPGTTSGYASTPWDQPLHRIHRDRTGYPIDGDDPISSGLHLLVDQLPGRGADADRARRGALLQ
jgi:hypothetical protein